MFIIYNDRECSWFLVLGVFINKPTIQLFIVLDWYVGLIMLFLRGAGTGDA